MGGTSVGVGEGSATVGVGVAGTASVGVSVGTSVSVAVGVAVGARRNGVGEGAVGVMTGGCATPSSAPPDAYGGYTESAGRAGWCAPPREWWTRPQAGCLARLASLTCTTKLSRLRLALDLDLEGARLIRLGRCGILRRVKLEPRDLDTGVLRVAVEPVEHVVASAEVRNSPPPRPVAPARWQLVLNTSAAPSTASAVAVSASPCPLTTVLRCDVSSQAGRIVIRPNTTLPSATSAISASGTSTGSRSRRVGRSSSKKSFIMARLPLARRRGRIPHSGCGLA